MRSQITCILQQLARAEAKDYSLVSLVFVVLAAAHDLALGYVVSLRVSFGVTVSSCGRYSQDTSLPPATKYVPLMSQLC